MTVKELIELLKKQNQDAIVYHECEGINLQVSKIESYSLESKDDTILLCD